jgi:hypothetical protein
MGEQQIKLKQADPSECTVNTIQCCLSYKIRLKSTHFKSKSKVQLLHLVVEYKDNSQIKVVGRM